MNNFGIPLLLVGIIMLIITLAQFLKNRAFKNAQRVTGMVTRKERNVRGGKNRTTVYELTLSYTVDGTAYERAVHVLRDEYEAVDVGGRYEVLYRPDNPQKIMRPGNEDSRNVRTLLIMGVAVTAVGVVLILTGK